MGRPQHQPRGQAARPPGNRPALENTPHAPPPRVRPHPLPPAGSVKAAGWTGALGVRGPHVLVPRGQGEVSQSKGRRRGAGGLPK